MSSSSPARLTIDLDALAHNFAVLRAAAPGADATPVIKADGYGLGAAPIAKRLWAEGASGFFVARLNEGEALRGALGARRPAPIYVLDGFLPGYGSRLAANKLTPVLASLPQIEAANAYAAATGQRSSVVLQVDTGMNRQGVTLDEAKTLAASPDRLRNLDIQVLMSHLGSATDPTDARNALQLGRFNQVRPLFPKARASFAASAGIMLGQDYSADIVRPGISLYGGGPEERPDSRLKAVAKLEAQILYIRNVEPGETIGYGSRVVADRPIRMAVVGAGYADGLIRASQRGGYAWLRGQRRQVLIVTMDLIGVELGDAPAALGDYVELLGPNVLLDDIATAAGTVAHECLVRLGDRAERIYLGEA